MKPLVFPLNEAKAWARPAGKFFTCRELEDQDLNLIVVICSEMLQLFGIYSLLMFDGTASLGVIDLLGNAAPTARPL